jgi:hypothetical protein
METLGEFVLRLSERVGCFCHKSKSYERYSLKKADTNLRGKMGVFAWVLEHRRDNVFQINSNKKLGDKSNVTHLADKIVPGLIYVSRQQDSEGGRALSFTSGRTVEAVITKKQ